jgi:amidase
MDNRARRLGVLCLLCCATASGQTTVPQDASIAALRALLDSGRLSSESLVQYYLHRIDALNRKGPDLHAVISINPDALREARALDRARAGHRRSGPLEGIPVLIKDNIETADHMPTTAGSLALLRNFAQHDAPIVSALRAGGAIILGKTNLSEWANFRSTHSISGWSAVGGLTRNPFVLDRTACGSSSGSGAAIAADLAAAALGTETDGSVTCPASMNGIVGLKPTVGLLSQQGIVPISRSQDTAGPMGRSVEDVARLLMALTGHDYVAALNAGRVQGMRIGVLRFKAGADPELDGLYEHALAQLTSAGATLVKVDMPAMEPIQSAEQQVLLDEFKHGIDAYLEHAPASVTTRDLGALIAFDRSSSVELQYFGQELFEQAEATRGTDETGYPAARAQSQRLAATEGIDRLLHGENLSVLVAPTTTPAWRIDLIYGDPSADSSTTLAAVAGYPHLTVPMGQVHGLPVGLSFMGPAQSEQLLLDCGLAFQARAGGFVPPRYIPSLEVESFGRPTGRAAPQARSR